MPGYGLSSVRALRATSDLQDILIRRANGSKILLHFLILAIAVRCASWRRPLLPIFANSFFASTVLALRPRTQFFSMHVISRFLSLMRIRGAFSAVWDC